MMLTVLEQTLLRVFAVRGEVGPTGQPLYAYRLTAGEFVELEGLVLARLRRDHDLTRREAAAVVLYAAERFCQRHRSGVWKWETGLGEDASAMLREAMIAALTEYWRRPLVKDARGARLLLWSVAREGGLPRALLADEDGHIAQVLRRAIAERELLHGELVATDELVSEQLSRLPTSLQDGDVVTGLLSELVDAICALRREVSGLVESPEPLLLLDQRQPRWRSRLPIRVDDDVARRLVAGLVTQAAQPSDAPFDITLRLRLRDDRWRVERRLLAPPRVPASVLASSFRGAELSPRMELVLLTDAGTSAVAAELRLAGSGDFYRVHPRRTAEIGLGRRLRLGLRAHGAQHTIDPPGGEPPGADSPWVFPDLKGADWLGDGSQTSRAEALLVCWPAAARIEVDGELTELGSLRSDPERRVGRLRGALRVYPEGEDDVGYCVQTRSEAERALYRLSPAAFSRIGGQGSALLRGVPDVHRITPTSRRLVPSALEWARVGHPGTWAPLTEHSAAFGDLWLRVVDRGALRLRRRVLRVPEDVHLTVRPLPERGHGEVCLSGPARLRPARAAGVQMLRRKHPAAGLTEQIKVKSGDAPDTMLRIKLVLDVGPSVWVKVPLPRQRLELVGADHAPVPPDESAAVDRLIGYRAAAVDLNPSATYHLTGRCVAANIGWTLLGTLRSEGGGRLGLPLDEVDDRLRLMLASASDLDACVEIGLMGPGQDLRGLLKVYAYPRALDITRPPEGASRPSRIDAPEDAPPLQVELRPLHVPDAEPLLAPPLPGGGWGWPAAAGEGQWLLTAWESEAAARISGARPRLVTVLSQDAALPPPGPSALEQAAALRTPTARAAAVCGALTALAHDPSDPGWPILRARLETLSALPATTFDAVAQLARCPDTVAIVALQRARAGGLGVFVEAMETLPFAWWLVPPVSWARALRTLQAQLDEDDRQVRALLPPHLAAQIPPPQQQLADTIGVLGAQGGVLHAVAEWLRHCAGLRSQWGMIHLIAEAQLSALSAELIRVSAELRWPELSEQDSSALMAATAPPEGLLQQLVPGITCRWHADTILAPAIAAWAAVAGTPLSATGLLSLRRLRAFGPDWFDAAWGLMLARLWSQPTTRRFFEDVDDD